MGIFRDTVERWHTLTQEIQELKTIYEISKNDHGVLQEIEKEFPAFEKKFSALEREMYLSGKYDAGSAALTITAGAGGQDAEDWAGMLSEMYAGYAHKKNWNIQALDEAFGDVQAKAGRKPIKHVTFEIEGPYAYGLLKKETGVHRLVRISPFSAKKLRHTSFAAVEVLPDIHEVDEKAVELKPEELRVETARSSGPGGQNVNKRETAVRIVHIPTNISAACQSERSQSQNREKAMKLLRAKLFHEMQKQHAEEIQHLRGEKMKIEWASQIRSYVLHPYKLVKDHRTEYESHDPDEVLSGDVGGFIEAELQL